MFSKQEPNFSLNVDELLSPYFYLDESLFKGEDDGEACFKKYSNKGNGVPLNLQLKLEHLAKAIIENTYAVAAEERLKYIDLFTLYANHLDQQRFGEKPAQAEKERLVLLYLRAANRLSLKLNYDKLHEYDVRELSSHDQMLHYLGKAERYEPSFVELRLVKLENSLKIARYLSSLTLSKEQDPHAFKNRVPTRELPVNYCYQDLGRYDDAVALILPQLATDSAFHKTQANVQLTSIYTKQYLATGINKEKVLQYANQAVTESTAANSSLLSYNARQSKMLGYQAVGCLEEANEIAHAIIAEMDSNPNCGAKVFHREAAEKVLRDNTPSFSHSGV
jgi:hypothetical protein